MAKEKKSKTPRRPRTSSATDATLDQDRAAWLRMRRVRRAAVVRLRRTALGAPDIETVLTDALEVATRILDMDLAKVLEHDAARDNLIVRAARGWPTDVAGRVLEHAQETSQAGFALRIGHAIVVEDLRRVDAFRSTPLLSENDVVSSATVIIHGQLTPWGVLSVHSTKRRMVTPDELDFLRAVADVIAAAIHRFVLARPREQHPDAPRRQSPTTTSR